MKNEGIPIPPNHEGSVREFVDVAVQKARARAREVVDRASLNEAIRVVDELSQEVDGIEMPTRFSRTLKPTESVYNIRSSQQNPALLDLTEDKYKKETLQIALNGIKNKILSCIGELNDIVMDIEATKTEG